MDVLATVEAAVGDVNMSSRPRNHEEGHDVTLARNRGYTTEAANQNKKYRKKFGNGGRQRLFACTSDRSRLHSWA